MQSHYSELSVEYNKKILKKTKMYFRLKLATV